MMLVILNDSTIIIQTNTFQCVLASDDIRSFAIFLYLDEGIQWGPRAQIGLATPNSDTVNHTNIIAPEFSLPGALTDQSVNIELTENTGTAGKWAFRLDAETVLQPGGM